MDYTALPSGFNPLSYLILNPDVRRKGVDPFLHYINHGHAEKRRYRIDHTHRMILACIMKMEENYLLEWIAYHRNEGFDHLIIGDNGGSDRQTKLLTELDRTGVIERIDLIGKERPQLAFYNSILGRDYKPDTIIGFIDTDEFVYPQNTLQLGANVISSLFDDRNVGAAGLNWAVYGSAGLLAYSDEPVVKRFQYRAKQSFSPNRHIKSFVRSGASRQFTGAPHAVLIEPGYSYISTSGEPIQWQGSVGSGLSSEIIWSKVRLNHYILKSRSEYEIRKKRGSATTAKNDVAKQAETYFSNFDKNEILEPFPDYRYYALRLELQRLGQALESKQSNKNSAELTLRGGAGF